MIVGCLPAFKSLVANRAAARRTNNDSARSNSKVNSRIRKASIPLDSFSNDKKSVTGSHTYGSESQENLAKPEDTHAITVKNDVVSTSPLALDVMVEIDEL